MATLLKGVLLIVCVTYIVFKITHSQQHLSEWFALGPEKTAGLLVTLALMPLNWILEGLKWKILLAKQQERISLKDATVSVLIGVAAGIFTPNRVGEFAGKVVSLKNTPSSTVIKLNILAGTAQSLATLFFGTIALCFIHEIAINKPVLILFSALLISIATYIYTKSNWLFKLFNKLSSNKIHYPEIELIEPRTKVLILGLSFVRYAVFAAQFILLLHFSGIHLSLITLAGLVSVTFLISTIMPTFALSEIAVRGSVAVFVIGSLSNQEAIILADSFLLWIINIALPALFGCLCFMQLKPLSNRSSSKDVV